jgi:diketogulonate reductase-like aldo/keto reductase
VAFPSAGGEAPPRDRRPGRPRKQGGAGIVPHVTARTGARMPALGQGTWRMGEKRSARRGEVAALRLGLDLGMTLIDTAEMYAGGGAEKVVGEAIRGRRDGVFLVSKVLPENASRAGTMRAAERSLRRLGTDRIDLYLLHWEGSHPLAETLEAFTRLREAGKIIHYGLSNFDRDLMEKAESLPGGAAVAADQVLYHLGRRAAEGRLLPWCAERGVVLMAYAPLAEGRLLRRRALTQVARRHGVPPARVALAWTLRLPGVVSIPKASDPAHVRDNAAAVDLKLTPEDFADLDAAFPPPPADEPIGML